MTKWIRWSGLAGFLAVVGLIAALFIFLLPFLIKSGVEFAGTKLAGAKVTLDDADVTLSPLGVRLEGLQVADARAPMMNLMEFDEAVADLELAPLIIGKAISNELSVSNLRFHTERETSGALEVVIEETEEEKSPSLKEKASEALPSVDEVLAKETLSTPGAGEALKAAWNENSQLIDDAFDKVPDDSSIAQYEEQIQAITSGRLESIEDFRERKRQLDELKEQFKQDRDAVRDAREVVRSAKTEVSAKLTELRQAPSEDLAYLKDKYQLSGSGVSNITGLLFGDDAANWAREALYWYEKVKPYLESGDSAEADSEKDEKAPRLAGRFIHFPSDDPWPDFMIRTARLTGPFDGGQLVISGKDITHQQTVTGRPTVFTVTGEGLQKIGDLDGRLVLNHTVGNATDTLTLAISDWKMAPLNLGVAGARLASSRVQLDATAEVVRGELDADLDANVTQANFTGEGQTLFARELNAALQGINNFNVDAGVTGTLKNPDVAFGSDLDRQINSAISNRIRAKQDEFERKLRNRLNEKMSEYAGEYAEELQQLAAMEGSLDDKLGALKDLASAELEDFKAQQEREAREKLDAEKAAAEEKARKEAEARKQELKDQAKDKLKNLF
ncbi:TIGR03545 family protein [Thalassolituus maritimus]|uniref:TIGR03545 family protein n=1 Tax=Thalassolituus maritimus TaxID=484498 RepID=A0A1N7J6X0_9GAMM|nr:TIGR03545 family protein [Thalassolituus maritimus]SIS45070.1 TIGR03545 family protein [Thalassolituus maritimus]